MCGKVYIVVMAGLFGTCLAADVADVDTTTPDDHALNVNESFVPCFLPPRWHCYDNTTGKDIECLQGKEKQDYPEYYIDGKKGECYQCFMPHQCLVNNTCATGSDGPTCERCKKGSTTDDSYYRVGNSCQPCYRVPWTMFVLAFFLVPILAMICYNGLTTSVAIKIRQMVSMQQLVMLTLSVKVLWQSKVTLNILQQFGYILGSIDSSFMAGCYQNIPYGVHYVQWIFIIVCVTATFGLGGLLDLLMKRFVKYEPDEDLVDRMWRWRMMMRRLVFAIIIMLFSPLLSATCQSYSCAVVLKGYTKDDKDYYLFDQDERYTCESTVHQFVNMVLFLLAFALCIVAPPLMIFAGMVAYKWNTLDRDMVLWGWYYESFRPRFAFWEALPLTLRLVYVACTDVYDIRPEYSLGIMLSCTIIYFAAVIVCRPYKPIELVNYKTVDMHNIFEGASVLGVVIFQITALYEVFAENVTGKGLDVVYSLILVYFGLVTLVWLALCAHTIRENPIVEFDDLEFPVYAIQEGTTEDIWNVNLGTGATGLSQRRQTQVEAPRRKAVSVAEASPASLLEKHGVGDPNKRRSRARGSQDQ